MKIVNVSEAEGQLSRLIAEVNDGEFVVLKDGDKEVTLHPGGMLDIEQDFPELESELLKAAQGPFKPYSPDEMRGICERLVEEKRRA